MGLLLPLDQHGGYKQFVTFVLFTHPEKPLLADGQGKVPLPEPA
jgi:hypothetical protein